MPKIAVALSGSGVFDGSEIHETTLTLLALEKKGAEVVCVAPNVEQAHVIDHLTGKEAAGEKRNVLVESARIARGAVEDTAGLNGADFDALVFPGGFGAAKNLCGFAFKGADCSVNPDIARLIREAHGAGKPLAFLCIAPVIAAKVLGPEGVEVTIGSDADVAAGIEKAGGRHISLPVDAAHIDRARKVVSSPGYMLASRISEVEASVNALIDGLWELL